MGAVVSTLHSGGGCQDLFFMDIVKIEAKKIILLSLREGGGEDVMLIFDRKWERGRGRIKPCRNY